MNSPQKKSFDITAVVSQALRYVRHGRLMAIMGCLGILSGLIYYMFATPLYEARSLVYVRGHGSPVQTRDVPETMEASGLNRVIMEEFSSKRNIIEAAKRMKLVQPDATWTQVVEMVPVVSIDSVDNSHLEVAVQARTPEAVREFARELVEEFRRQQEAAWKQYRDAALNRYAEELKALQEKASAGLKRLSAFEREEKIAESVIEQTRLNELPKDLIVTRELLLRMDDLGKKLAEVTNGKTTDAAELPLSRVLEELSLLSTFEKERDIKIGEVIRRPTAGGSAPLMATGPTAKVAAEVVVQPGMVDPLEPWQKLEKERRILEDRKQELAKQYLPGHELMKQLADDLEANERSLKAELGVLRQRFELEHEHFKIKLAALEGKVADYHKVNEEFSQNSQAYADIEKEKALWDKAREHLAEKLAVVTFSENRNWVEMRFKGHTSLRDEIPVSPNKTKLLMLSILLALGGALGVPTLVNLSDSSASTLQQLEEVTGVKGIGIVPRTPREIIEDVCRSPAIGATVPNYLLECFRLIRSHVLLSPGKSGKSQVVMVTSARPSEGKTTLAANMAWAFQSMGGRTLLIDCDLRRGRLHGLSGVPNEPGMTRLLKGECTIKEAVQKTDLPLLDIIPRGPVMVGTTDLLVQQVFEKLLATFKADYDHIVLDTPPVLGLSETTSLQRVVDGVLFVVRAEKTPRKDVVDGMTLLRKAGAHLYGIVLSDLDLNRVSNYYNYYYYSPSYYEADLDSPLDPALDVQDLRREVDAKQGA